MPRNDTVPYAPSHAEREAFAALRCTLTPGVTKHERYLRQVERYLGESSAAPPLLAHDGHVRRVVGFRLWHSRLFARRYLVAYAETSWYRHVAPTAYAIMSVLSGVGALPPLVIAPADRRHTRSEGFRSVIEHEFVHINQALLGTLVCAPRGSPAERVATAFFVRLRSEYQAHFLQFVRWPRLFPPTPGLSLTHWCLLRGLADALETILLAAWRGEFGPRDVTAFLDDLPERRGRWFNRLGVDRLGLADALAGPGPR